MQTVAISRGQVVIAAGQAKPDANEIVVTAMRRADGIHHLFYRLS